MKMIKIMKKELEKYVALAKEAGDTTEKDGDRDYFFSELDTI